MEFYYFTGSCVCSHFPIGGTSKVVYKGEELFSTAGNVTIRIFKVDRKNFSRAVICLSLRSEVGEWCGLYLSSCTGYSGICQIYSALNF